jgi:hypothetical protein
MKRLLEGDGSELERGLLDALRLERPSPELEQRMRAAIGLGPIGATAVPETSTPTAAALPAGKTVGWGAIVGGAVAAAVVAGSVLLLTQSGSSGGAPPPAVAPAPAKVAPPAEPRVSPSTPADLHVDELPQEQAVPKVRSQINVAPASASLKEEIRLIDSARVAVKKNESARALGILDQYARRFPDGSFKEEARVLRAEARKSP